LNKSNDRNTGLGIIEEMLTIEQQEAVNFSALHFSVIAFLKS